MVKYKLTVDEPWGFNHNGSNILHGIVIKQLSSYYTERCKGNKFRYQQCCFNRQGRQ